MRNRFLQKVMNLLLSAMVLAWGIVLPGVQHVHAGGSDPAHGHDDCHEVVDYNSHNHDSGDHEAGDHETDVEHHEHSTALDVSLLVDYVLHLHWELLGVEFSMPMPEAPVESDDNGNTAPPAIVRVIGDIVPATPSSPSLGRVLLAAICTPSADVVWSLEPIPCPRNLVTSIPLCDSARFERSGVLLA